MATRRTPPPRGPWRLPRPGTAASRAPKSSCAPGRAWSARGPAWACQPPCPCPACQPPCRSYCPCPPFYSSLLHHPQPRRLSRPPCSPRPRPPPPRPPPLRPSSAA
eukprot:scaffold2857_cov121-Isochrysis_galbana.AAC.11